MTWRVGDSDVIEGMLTIPSQGAWRVEAQVNPGEGAPSAGARVTVDAAGTSYSGTVRSASEYGGRLSLEIIGGAGGLRTQTAPASYYQVPALTVAAAIAGQAGEVIEQATAAALGAIVLPFWLTPVQDCARAWQALADALGLSWWVSRDGLLVMGTRAGGEYQGTAQLLESDERLGLRTMAPETCDAEPGQTIAGLVAEQLEYTIAADGQRLSVQAKSMGAAAADAAGPTRDLARMARTSSARVARMNTDGTVDVVPDDPSIKGQGMQRIPLWLGVPGSVKVPVGARVGLLYLNGKPQEPAAALFAGDDLTELSLGSGSGGYVALADAVATVVGNIVTWANAHVHTSAAPGNPTTPPVTPLTAQPSTAATKVKAE